MIKYIKYIKQILTIYLLLNLTNAQTSGLEPFCQLIGNDVLECKNFQSFKSLDFSMTKIAFSEVTIEPRVSLNLELDENLSFDGLQLKDNAVLIISNLNRINVGHNPFKAIKTGVNGFGLVLKNLFWRFNTFDCQIDPVNLNSLSFVFSDLKLKKFSIESGQYERNLRICPLIFKKSSIETFEINIIKSQTNFIYEDVKQINSNLNTNSLNDLLDINVQELNVKSTNNYFISKLDKENLLNLFLFNKLKKIYLDNVYIESIDETSIADLKFLKSLWLLNLDFENMLKNGVKWMNSLNSQFNLNLDDPAEVARLKKEDFFELVFSFGLTPKFYEFNDDSFCYFKNFPYNQLVMPVFYVTDSSSFKSLPCSCNIYNMFKYYSVYSDVLKKNKPSDDQIFLPDHCFNISSTILDEQKDFCKGQDYGKYCEKNFVSSTEAAYSEPTITTSYCLKPDISAENKPAASCKCLQSSFNINYLECSDENMTEMPLDFSTDNNIEFNYVSFVGSSVKKLSQNQFNNLRLTENASIIISGIDEFESDVFSRGIISKGPYRLVIQNSDLFFLFINSVFRDATLSQLEFINFTLPEQIRPSNFLLSKIDTFILSSPQPNSNGLQFSFQPVFDEISIRKFKIENGRDIFKKNSFPRNEFGIDLRLLNRNVFKEIEELEITRTTIDYIDSDLFKNTESFLKLKTIRLENIHLKEIVSNELKENYTSPNWLSSPKFSKIYFGHEVDTKFEFNDESLCYFVDLNPNANVYIYDNLDSSAGVACTCTIYWIYRNFNFDLLDLDPDSKYIPNCIKDLKNNQNVKTQLNICLNERNPEVYCKEPKIDTSLTSQSITTYQVTSTTEFPNTENNRELETIKGLLIATLVCVSVLIAVAVTGAVAFIVYKFFYLKRKLKIIPTTKEPLSV